MIAAARDASTELDPQAEAFYRRVLRTVNAAGLPVLVGGAYAFAIYTGIERHTKDLDVFVRRGDYERVTQALRSLGTGPELTYPHGLGKVYAGPLFVDVIFNSGNGVTPVDDGWFEHAVDAEILGVPARIQPVEEMIWSKALLMERERYDGADVAHLLRARADTMDWPRLLQRMEPHWRVLLSHLVLFGFVYPAEASRVPAWVVDALVNRLGDETHSPPPGSRLCRGTLLSREQYLYDVGEGYVDARLRPFGNLSAEEIAAWTAAIEER